MCTLPALMVAQAGAQYVAGVNEANATNANNLQQQMDSGLAAGWQYADENRRFAYNSKALQQEGYDLAIKSRENVATGITSAASSGVGGLTLGSLVADAKQKGAENQNRIQTKREDLRSSLASNIQSIYAQNKSVINATPMDSGPSALGLAIDMGTAYVTGKAKQ